MDQLTSPRRRRSERGLTLLEVTVALGVLAFGLLGVLAMQVHALKDGRVGRHQSRAAQIARNQMEFLNRVPWDTAIAQDTGGWVIAGDTVNNQVDTGGATVTEQAFNVDWRITDDPANPDLRQIDVRVNWQEPSDPPGFPVRRFAITSVRFRD
jgi:type II secretory pathway pseudopilin PulG